MSIVSTVADIRGSAPRMIYYRCTDHLGAVHQYGPVVTSDEAFDAEAFKTTVATKVAARLAGNEFDSVIGG